MAVRIKGDPESCLDQFHRLLVPDLIKLDGYLMSLISLISQLGKLIKVVKQVLFCDQRLTPSDLCEDSESQPSFWNLSQEVLDTALFCESSFSVSNIINRFFVNQQIFEMILFSESAFCLAFAFLPFTLRSEITIGIGIQCRPRLLPAPLHKNRQNISDLKMATHIMQKT